MDEGSILLGLLIAATVLGVLLVLASAAAFGRILADLEYQKEAGLNGVRRIQSHLGLRTHGNRVGLGLFTLTASILTLAGAPQPWQTWVSRTLFLVVLSSYTLSSVLDWLDERRQVAILIRERKMQRRYDAGDAS